MKTSSSSSDESSSSSSFPASTTTTSSNEKLVVNGGGRFSYSPTERDVLCGRGEHGKRHEGNVLFRELVEERKDEYTRPSTGRSRKNDIARDLYNQICERGGRFLKRRTAGGGETEKTGKNNNHNEEENSETRGVGEWIEVDQADALEKCRQALREKEKSNVPRSQQATTSGSCTTNCYTSPRPQDVLFGRGEGSKLHEGNVRFRELVEERKEEYTQSAANQKEKSNIARDLYKQIHEMGGRFLARSKESKDESCCGWVEVDEIDALEKCKQALRQNRKRRNLTNDHGQNGNNIFTTPTPKDVLCGRGEGGKSQEGNVRFRELVKERKAMYRQSTNPKEKYDMARDICSKIRDMGGRFLSRKDVGKACGWVEVDEICALEKCRQALRQNHEWWNPKKNNRIQFVKEVGQMPDVPSNNVSAASSMTVIPSGMLSDSMAAKASQMALFHDIDGHFGQQTEISHETNGDSSLSQQRLGSVVCKQVPAGGHEAKASPSPSNLDNSVPDVDYSNVDPSHSNAEIYDFLMRQILGDTSRPRFTDEQAQRELAALSADERDAILCDVFGKMCTIHQTKRARLESDAHRMKLLVMAMRLEIQRMTSERKQALLEAQLKCSAEEFSDSRLERFLRCEGLDAKLGAERFVRYWECRRKVFGPEKYTQRMTLSEAFSDDLVAIETGFCSLLPSSDTSGRQLLLSIPSNHPREGYTSESLLRAYWYVIEICSRENNHVHSGIVLLGWLYETTIWDYDQLVWDPVFEYDRTCWPVKTISKHCCCEPSSLVVRIFKPIIFSIMGKEMRSRFIVDAVPQSEVADTLADYGIAKHMLPKFMGGTLEFDQSEWIRARRVAEMEEL